MVCQTRYDLMELEVVGLGRGFDVVLREVWPLAARAIVEPVSLEEVVLVCLSASRKTRIGNLIKDDVPICLHLLMGARQFRVEGLSVVNALRDVAERHEWRQRSERVVYRRRVGAGGRNCAVSLL